MQVKSHGYKFRCRSCSAVFKNKPQLRRHFTIIHNNSISNIPLPACGDAPTDSEIRFFKSTFLFNTRTRLKPSRTAVSFSYGCREVVARQVLPTRYCKYSIVSDKFVWTFPSVKDLSHLFLDDFLDISGSYWWFITVNCTDVWVNTREAPIKVVLSRAPLAGTNQVYWSCHVSFVVNYAAKYY